MFFIYLNIKCLINFQYRKELAERVLFGKKEDELRSKAMADEAAEDEEEDEDEEEEEDGKRKRPVQQKDEGLI